MASIILGFVVLVYLTSIYVGCKGYLMIDFIFLVKSLSNPYFNLGITFLEHDVEDPEYVEQELILGIFFIELIIVFYKEKIDA